MVQTLAGQQPSYDTPPDLANARPPPAKRGGKSLIKGTLNGMHFDANVGADAHIGPRPHGTSWYVEWDRGTG